MTFRFLGVTTAVLALAVAGCNSSESTNGAAPDQPAQAAKAAGDQTIAHAAGLDTTLAGPEPYTVLIPRDDAFGKVEGALKDPTNPQNRAELTRVLTYHILPGVVLVEDLGKAVDNGDGKTLVQTVGGGTLTATKEGGKVVLSDASGGKATIVEGDQKRSNGVIHYVDAILMPAVPSAPARQQ